MTRINDQWLLNYAFLIPSLSNYTVKRFARIKSVLKYNLGWN